MNNKICNFSRISTKHQDVPREKAVTLKLLQAIKEGKFLAYISEVTIKEILEASEKKRKELLDLSTW